MCVTAKHRAPEFVSNVSSVERSGDAVTDHRWACVVPNTPLRARWWWTERWRRLPVGGQVEG